MKRNVTFLFCEIAVATALGLGAADFESAFRDPPPDARPQTYFFVIGGNLSKEGLTADLEAIAAAGIKGVHFFHGLREADILWPRTGKRIQCLSAEWDEIVAHAADECARLGLKFEMQNCTGWSMSGGPWITPDKAMRKLVCFEPGKRPAYGADDDFHEIGEVTFPRPKGWGEPELVPTSVTTNGDVRTFDFGRPVTVRTLILPPPRGLVGGRQYVIDVGVTFEAETANGWQTVLSRKYPRGSWQDRDGVTFACGDVTARRWRLAYRSKRPVRSQKVAFSPVSRMDGWESLGGWTYHDLPPRGTAAERYLRGEGTVTLVFGHVNLKRTNSRAPAGATGWECDKLDARGCRANFDGYLGRLVKGPLAGGKLKGLVVDSWECYRQTWTWRMEDEFRRLNGYELRPNLPTLFGFPSGDPADAERFLRDWRRTVSTLIEENYYGTFAKIGRENGLTVQFETSFADVIPGDPLRFWKYADIPMCEFWQPFDAKSGVGSDNFKPARPCVSAAHVYGKRRVQAESFTSFDLTYNENFKLLKSVADRNIARGITHLVFHTYTHQPQVGKDFLPPGSSFGARIGTPFLRGQTWWRFMPEFTAYLARCGLAMERGLPAVDVLWYLGDEIGFRPDENAPFPDGYKYDYCNFDVLTTRLDVRDGRWTLPDGMSYRVLWIPGGTFLLPETERRLADLAAKGGRIVRGELKPDWPSPLEKLGFRPKAWYQRRDGETDIFFVVLGNGETEIVTVRNGRKTVLDPVTGQVRADWKDVAQWDAETPVELRPAEDYPAWATCRTYVGTVERPASDGPAVLSLGDVRDWAEVFVNGQKAATLWCEPYACDIRPFLKDGANEVRVDVTSTWYNRLVHDAGLPEAERGTWTIAGPEASAAFHESGLVGPVRLLQTRKERKSQAEDTETFRILSYNVKHGEGMDKRLDLARTADVVKRANPTYVGLQEIDQMTRRIAGTNTCQFVSERCALHATFAKAMPYKGGEYGNALLSREAPLSVKTYPLPVPPNLKQRLREPRVLVMCEFKDFWVGTMHINGEPSSIPLVRRAVEECAATKPVFVTGDWNACPKTVVLKLMKEFMTILSPTDRPTVNDFGNCIDYIAVDTAHAKDFKVVATDVIQELVVSDHRPIYVDVKRCKQAKE